MNVKRTLYALLLMVSVCSCGSYKNIPYFQDLDQNNITNQKVDNYSPLTIQPADILAINVNSRNPESSAIFNGNQSRVGGSATDNSSLGYLVDPDGLIYLPLLGEMKVSGLTTTQLRKKLTEKLLALYKDPVVNIRITNFKISVFGDVLRPDTYSIQNERVTVTQALSLAGDLNITAKRKNVMLIRDIDGKRTFIPIDLTSKSLYQSPYFYLKNNDEIYVTPDRTKYATVDRGYRTTQLVLTGLSIIAIVLSNLYR
ncbi:polysaccharide export outer membrane protein [Mucilaginibacter sp. UYNi724]